MEKYLKEQNYYLKKQNAELSYSYKIQKWLKIFVDIEFNLQITKIMDPNRPFTSQRLHYASKEIMLDEEGDQIEDNPDESTNRQINETEKKEDS